MSQFDELIKYVVQQTNFYANQNGRVFVTDLEEMKAFIGINYIMGINKLPYLAEYWRVDEFIGNDAITNVTTRKRFLDIMQNMYFVDNTTRTDESSKSFKIDPVIDHLNCAFKNAFADDSGQSIDEHTVKFKGKSGMKQYIKSKPIRWGFKAWMRCPSNIGYAYHFKLNLEKKSKNDLPVGEYFILDLVEGFKNTYATIFFDNFFSSPTLIQKLYDDELYDIETVRKDRKHMSALKVDKKLKKGLIMSAVDDLYTMSTGQHRAKGSATKTVQNCPTVIKMYKASMGGVDLLDQRVAAYRADRKSKFRFYLRIFFDLMGIACTNGFIAFNVLCPEKNSKTLDFKIGVTKSLLCRYRNQVRSVTKVQPTKKIETTVPLEEPLHLSEILATRSRCEDCKTNSVEN